MCFTDGYSEKISDTRNLIIAGRSASVCCQNSQTDDNEEIDWIFLPADTNRLRYLYVDDRMSDLYESRLAVNKSKSGEYNLTVTTVRLSDAGRYVAFIRNTSFRICCTDLSILGDVADIIIVLLCTYIVKPS